MIAFSLESLINNILAFVIRKYYTNENTSELFVAEENSQKSYTNIYPFNRVFA